MAVNEPSVEYRRRLATVRMTNDQLLAVQKNYALAALGAAYAAAWDANRASEPSGWEHCRAELDRALDALLEGNGYKGLGIKDETD